jgi:hypothetical protein
VPVFFPDIHPDPDEHLLADCLIKRIDVWALLLNLSLRKWIRWNAPITITLSNYFKAFRPIGDIEAEISLYLNLMSDLSTAITRSSFTLINEKEIAPPAQNGMS